MENVRVAVVVILIEFLTLLSAFDGIKVECVEMTIVLNSLSVKLKFAFDENVTRREGFGRIF